MVSVMLLVLRPGPDQDRYRAISPGGLLRALTDGTKWKGSINRKCRNRCCFGLCVIGMDPGHDAMAMATIRSHVPCSRPRLAPYAVGTLQRCSRVAVLSSRVRARRREVGLRGWGSIVPIHTRPTVVWIRSPGPGGASGRHGKS